MRKRLILSAFLVTLFLSSVTLTEAGPAGSQNQTANQFNPRDFSGIWLLTGGGNAFAGFGPNTRPALTPAGTEAMRGRIPSRAVPYASLSNDPEYQCNPAGFPKLLMDAEPMELLQVSDRLLQVFQWEHRIRYIWMDGRELPTGENLDNLGPAWYGHSVGRWDGDTLVINTTGLEERAWLDRPGHPKSLHARIEERYRRTGPDTIELRMTLYDPAYYTGPWEASARTFTREKPQTYTYFGWKGLFAGITEGICAPVNEVEGYNKRFRDVAEPPR
jgi:hypothetical protein